ncbi:MAG: hypothetical protein V9E94_19880 [Microthrixaceae bacterium]
MADASTIKVFGTEFYLEAFRLLMEILGPRAYLDRKSTGAILRGAPRDVLPQPAHPDLRRRNERDPA